MRLKPILQSNKFYIIFFILIILDVLITTKLISYKSIYNQQEDSFVGTIINIKKTDYGYSLTLNAKEKLLVYAKYKNYNIGDYVFIKGKLEKPDNNTVLNNFNYREYLYQNKIFYRFLLHNLI